MIIIFGGNDKASNKFLEDMKNEFEMSMIGEMNFFLGLKFFLAQRRYLYFLDQVFERFFEKIWTRKL